jgi:hypothetical protein
MKFATWIGVAITTAAGLITSSVEAKKFEAPPMPAGYDDPGPLPDDMLAAVVGGLKSSLKDPYSVRDFSLCQTRVMKAVPALAKTIPWQRAYRVTHFMLNAKNSYGGYTGLQAGLATFKEGKLERIALIGTPIQTGRPKEYREPCTPITDQQIQELMASPN